MSETPSARRTLAAIERLATERRAILDAHLADALLVRLPGNVPPWTDSNIRVHTGEWISILASGRLVLATELDLWLAPSLALWGRIGGRGPLLNGTRDTFSFAAEHDGALELALYNGEWATQDGALATPVEAYATSGGAIEALVLRWRGQASEGLAALDRALPGDPLIAGELDRLGRGITPPAGWQPLWFLGPTEIFRDADEDGRAAIEVDTHNDVGIVQKRVSFPLGPATTLAWQWRVDTLPAIAAENTPLGHDYMSLALEFENGKDLTWYWSAALPAATHYTCPLPTWTTRETHWVVRSGPEGLGGWHHERRLVADDYRAAIGEPPARVVAVWLIAVSIFGHRHGRARFADVTLRDGDRELRVL
jgi:hypothetical protein